MLMSEATLEAPFIHPFLQTMFSSTIPLKMAHCCNLICNDSLATRRIRPDYAIDVYNQAPHVACFSIVSFVPSNSLKTIRNECPELFPVKKT
ncbi:hypothetical protein BCV71DRAFT_259655 [Rhizopus microsporus]|uniref:Uncharacterized protein n=1 Tax=Rhizopus microsporus TaxID=58291 RepID=A0A1X0SFX0_RHIZD|nr:hypothetical protein BCV71DRAFT_259655 [Rhizopus microsporus]